MKGRRLAGTTSGWAFVLLLGVTAPAVAQDDAELDLLELNRQLFETQILEQNATLFSRGSDERWSVVSRALSVCHPAALERGIC